MENKENTKTTWLGRYWYVALFAFGLVAFLLAIIILSATNTKSTNQTIPANSQANMFYLPLTEATIAKEYNDKALQYNATLNQWEVHKAIDFVAPVGADVCAVSNGTVTDIYSNYLDGTVVVIAHNGGLKSKYASLDSNVKVNVGDSVTGGQVIGNVAASAMSEAQDGAHLHFEMMENDKKIDPAGYLNLTSK